MKSYIPNPDTVFPNEYGTSCFLKNVTHRPLHLCRRLHCDYDDSERIRCGF